MDTAVLAALLPALPHRLGGRHRNPEDQIDDREEQVDGEMAVPAGDGHRHRAGHEEDAEQGDV